MQEEKNKKVTDENEDSHDSVEFVESEKDDINELEHLRKLFVGGLNGYTTEECLKAYYSQWGHVVDVVVMKDVETKRSRGFGFITYSKSSMVDVAQENRPHVIDGKIVEAKRALPRPQRETPEYKGLTVKKLFVGGLKDNHDEACLEEYFSEFGKVVSVKILTDKTSGKRRGFAFIEFDDYDSVDKAILKKHHSIKYVVVDVKKSIYSKDLQKKGTGPTKQENTNQKQDKAPPKNAMPPQQQMPPYQQAAPPQNYNQWGPPAPQMPPQNYGYGGYQQPMMPPPPQTPQPSWNYPPAPAANTWNATPPQPPRGPQPPPPAWQGQWGPPPPGPPAPMPPNQMPPPGTQPPPNWQQPAAAPPAAGPPPPPQHQQPQQAPPTNFGTGYQQNYGGGPTKYQNTSNRMNPYSGPPQTYNNAAPPAPGYAGYNAGPPANAISSGPQPISNGSHTSRGTNYRR